MSLPVLAKENIVLQAAMNNKEEAIRFTGDVLVKRGYVEPSYIEKNARERGANIHLYGQFCCNSSWY
ncbi:hypothetical protein GCM10020331_085510 [Ectobacillus funiculus]